MQQNYDEEGLKSLKAMILNEKIECSKVGENKLILTLNGKQQLILTKHKPKKSQREGSVDISHFKHKQQFSKT